MEIIKLLGYNWGYPTCEHMNEVRGNMILIQQVLEPRCNYLKPPIDLIGIGASGAFLLGAVSMRVRVNPVLLRKDKDYKIKEWVPRLRLFSDIVIIDDHFRLGESLKMIATQLKERDVLLCNNVKVYIARCWENDNPEYLAKGKQLLEQLYPNIQIWYH